MEEILPLIFDAWMASNIFSVVRLILFSRVDGNNGGFSWNKSTGLLTLVKLSVYRRSAVSNSLEPKIWIRLKDSELFMLAKGRLGYAEIFLRGRSDVYIFHKLQIYAAKFKIAGWCASLYKNRCHAEVTKI